MVRTQNREAAGNLTEWSSTVEVLKQLPRVLSREGYTDAYTLYGPLNARLERWSADLHLLPKRLQTLFMLFLLGMEVSVDRVSEVLTESEVDALGRLSILIRTNRGVHTGNLVLVPAYGYFVFAQRPTVDPRVYFGDDSAALAAHLMPSEGDECLDLCAGTGIQSMLCSGRGRTVIAVEVNPFAASHAELNMVMNGLEGRVEVRIGDLYNAVPGMQFDYVCANPPLLPFPDSLPYPFVGHGGSDGLVVTRKILDGLSTALKPTGLCQIIGTCLADESGPFCENELQALAVDRSWKICMTVPTSLPLNPCSRMFQGLAWSCATANSLPLKEVSNQFEEHLKTLGATHLNPFFLAVSPSDKPGLFLTRHYRQRKGFWFIEA